MLNGLNAIDAGAKARLGILRESVTGERRVALVPADVRRLADAVEILVEPGAGAQAGHPDADYTAAGASLLPREEFGAVDAVVSVRAPESRAGVEGSILISLGGRDEAVARRLAAARVTHLGLERLPRTSRAQSMDVLSSQASVSGYSAVLEGARFMTAMLPMLTTAAGIVRPAAMVALGAGVAGLQAIATARRLGAVVHGFDVRSAAREQVESLGAKFVDIDLKVAPSEAAGGYARAQEEDAQVRLRRALAPSLRGMQLIVTTAQVPGGRAPLLIDEATLSLLEPGSVIVDLAADSGGNTSATRADEIVVVGGVTILGPTNLPSVAAGSASRLFSGNVRALLEHIGLSRAPFRLDREDPIVASLLGAPAVQRLAA